MVEFKIVYSGNYKFVGSLFYWVMLVIYVVRFVVGMGVLGRRLMSEDERSKGSWEVYLTEVEKL